MGKINVIGGLGPTSSEELRKISEKIARILVKNGWMSSSSKYLEHDIEAEIMLAVLAFKGVSKDG